MDGRNDRMKDGKKEFYLVCITVTGHSTICQVVSYYDMIVDLVLKAILQTLRYFTNNYKKI